MKKVFLMMFLPAALAVALIQCSDDGGGGATNAKTAKAEFTDPTGTISNENATAVTNDLLSNAVEGLTATAGSLGFLQLPPHVVRAIRMNPTTGRLFAQTEDCADPEAAGSCLSGIAEDGSSGSIDLGCLADAGCAGECTGDGSISWGTADDVSTVEFSFNGFTCGDDEIPACNGAVSVTPGLDPAEVQTLLAAENPEWPADTVICFGVSCDVEGETFEDTSCYDPNGDILVFSDGGSIRCDGIEANEGCVTVTWSGEDSDGAFTVECTVDVEGNGCGVNADADPDLETGIGTTVGDCTVSRAS